jgi:NAD(P)-dependent dehydrogenase (short-subunit alcohol dehydrogenase family)
MSQSTLSGRRLAIIGAGSGIGRALARTAAKEGAELVLAGPDLRKLEQVATALEGSARVVKVDLTDEASIAHFVGVVSTLDHLVSTASMHANGPVATLELAAIDRALAAKVTGPLLLAKHTVDRISRTGSMTFFSGFAAWRPAAGYSVMATVNGALAFLVQALAVELAPVRVNAIAPGVVDSGSWDAMGADKEQFLRGVAERTPARRVGTAADIVSAVLFAVANPFVTGTVLHVDGGASLV